MTSSDSSSESSYGESSSSLSEPTPPRKREKRSKASKKSRKDKKKGSSKRKHGKHAKAKKSKKDKKKKDKKSEDEPSWKKEPEKRWQSWQGRGQSSGSDWKKKSDEDGSWRAEDWKSQRGWNSGGRWKQSNWNHWTKGYGAPKGQTPKVKARPNTRDDDMFDSWSESILGDLTVGEKASLRRLILEAQTMLVASLKDMTEPSEGTAPKKVGVAERNARMDQLRTQLAGVGDPLFAIHRTREVPQP